MKSFQICTDSLSKRFNREWIFHNLNYTFETGKVYAITGPNGSGKSTLMQILWGQMPPSSGQINYRCDGKPVEINDVYAHIAVATPYMDLIDEFTLEEQIDFHFKLRRARKGTTTADVISSLYLDHARTKQISNFSSGMKQRLKLGLAFHTEAAALFLDEPGTNLDRQALDWYKQNLQTFSAHTLTLIASNQPEEYPSNAVKLSLQDMKPSNGSNFRHDG